MDGVGRPELASLANIPCQLLASLLNIMIGLNILANTDPDPETAMESSITGSELRYLRLITSTQTFTSIFLGTWLGGSLEVRTIIYNELTTDIQIPLW